MATLVSSYYPPFIPLRINFIWIPSFYSGPTIAQDNKKTVFPLIARSSVQLNITECSTVVSLPKKNENLPAEIEREKTFYCVAKIIIRRFSHNFRFLLDSVWICRIFEISLDYFRILWVVFLGRFGKFCMISGVGMSINLAACLAVNKIRFPQVLFRLPILFDNLGGFFLWINFNNNWSLFLLRFRGFLLDSRGGFILLRFLKVKSHINFSKCFL